MTTPKDTTHAHFRIFYSWQSDLPKETNTQLIREALRLASIRIESERKEVHIIIDEATRDMPGSPNIPQTILNKIRQSDAFVADITTINKDRKPEQRAVPNPNVAVELGYALAHVGWGRIVMLFNKEHGAFPNDVPFDIDRQRVSDYHFATPSQEEPAKKENKKRLQEIKKPIFDLVYDAINAIIEHNPSRPDQDEVSKEERARLRDIETLRSTMSSIHIPTLDMFLNDITQGRIHKDAFLFWDWFNAKLSGSFFRLYDNTLKEAITNFHDAWGRCFSFYQHFSSTPGGEYVKFVLVGDLFDSDKQREDWNKLQEAADETRKNLDALLEYIHANYPEIDVKDTSNKAWSRYSASATIEEP